MEDFKSVRNIAYLGPETSFSAMAVDEFCHLYDMQCFTTPLTNIRQVIEYIEKNPDNLGVLPIENTLDGTIRESLDCIIGSSNPNIRILSEITMPVEYCLLSKTTELYSITNIIAPPRIISKCQNFIHDELPLHHTIVEAASMSEAAYDLRNYNLTYASIGNRKIAQVDMLNILVDNVHDDKNNKTKYILIGDMETAPSGKDRTTVAFRTNHTPGALLKILSIFLEHKINMTYISSQPSKANPNEYIFIVSLDGHVQGTNILKAIDEIKPKTSFFRYLGSYIYGQEVKFTD